MRRETGPHWAADTPEDLAEVVRAAVAGFARFARAPTPAEVMAAVGAVLLACNAALFFDQAGGTLWMDGEAVAEVDHTEDGCGHEFDVRPVRQRKPKGR